MKIIYIISGFITLGLGGIGIMIPLLPTTPFLIIAALCFGKSSKKLNEWFKGTKMYRENLDSLVKKEGMTRRAKIRVLTTVTVLLCGAAVLMKESTYSLLILVGVWIGHIIGIGWFIKTL